MAGKICLSFFLCRNGAAVSIALLPKTSLNQLLRTYPRAALLLTNQLSKNLWYQSKGRAILAREGVRQALIWLLLEIPSPLKSESESSYTVTLSEQVLAQILGVRRETIVRHLGELRKQGLAFSGMEKIYVQDRDKLEENLNTSVQISSSGNNQTQL